MGLMGACESSRIANQQDIQIADYLAESDAACNGRNFLDTRVDLDAPAQLVPTWQIG
jgi:hypothetical protein